MSYYGSNFHATNYHGSNYYGPQNLTVDRNKIDGNRETPTWKRRQLEEEKILMMIIDNFMNEVIQ